MREFISKNPFSFRTVERYLQQTQTYSDTRFVLEFTLLSFFLSMSLGLLSVWVLPLNFSVSTIDLVDPKANPLTIIISAVFFAPLLETIFGQWFPIQIVAIFTKRQRDLLTLSTIHFAFLHLHAGLVAFFGILPVGFCLSWSFIAKRKRSLRRAFLVTTLIHAFYNVITLCFYFLLRFLELLMGQSG